MEWIRNNIYNFIYGMYLLIHDLSSTVAWSKLGMDE